MVKYIAKRLLILIPVMAGITLLIFFIISLTPGDPGSLILGPLATEAEIQTVNDQLGYNRPFFTRYFDYLLNLVRGNFGNSWTNSLPVMESILSRMPVTLQLTIYSIILTVLVSLPLGVISAIKQYSFFDGASVLLAILLSAMPVFWLGLLLILSFSLKLGWFPATGADTLKSFVLPTITMAAGTIAVVTRMTRTTMLTVIREDYIRSAKAKGASQWQVIKHHALRNTLIPVITVLGINFGVMLGGTVLVENIFGMPGIGALLVDSIRMKDEPVVMGCVIILALFFCLVNLLVDVSYAYIDPRLRDK